MFNNIAYQKLTIILQAVLYLVLNGLHYVTMDTHSWRKKLAKNIYLHFTRNARLKSIRNSEWYLPITARPNHFWCRNIKTTGQHSPATPVHSFIMGVPTCFLCPRDRRSGAYCFCPVSHSVILPFSLKL